MRIAEAKRGPAGHVPFHGISAPIRISFDSARTPLDKRKRIVQAAIRAGRFKSAVTILQTNRPESLSMFKRTWFC